MVFQSFGWKQRRKFWESEFDFAPERLDLSQKQQREHRESNPESRAAAQSSTREEKPPGPTPNSPVNAEFFQELSSWGVEKWIEREREKSKQHYLYLSLSVCVKASKKRRVGREQRQTERPTLFDLCPPTARLINEEFFHFPVRSYTHSHIPSPKEYPHTHFFCRVPSHRHHFHSLGVTLAFFSLSNLRETEKKKKKKKKKKISLSVFVFFLPSSSPWHASFLPRNRNAAGDYEEGVR